MAPQNSILSTLFIGLFRLRSSLPEAPYSLDHQIDYRDEHAHVVVSEDTGRVTTYSYDASHRLIEETVADPVAGTESRAYTYDLAR